MRFHIFPPDEPWWARKQIDAEHTLRFEAYMRTHRYYRRMRSAQLPGLPDGAA